VKVLVIYTIAPHLPGDRVPVEFDVKDAAEGCRGGIGRRSCRGDGW
jgi:hypothetical protein